MAPVTFAILILALVAVGGLLVGGIRIRGIGLGPAGVLFTGVVFGHFGATIDSEVATFAKEFGLILFVFAIGLQLGPGIVQLWKQQGLLLNAMAAAIVAQGVALVVALYFLLDLPSLAVAGLFSGATTNTPSLGAAEQTASMIAQGADGGGIETLAAAYAVAYPGGVVGIIAAMLLIRRLFGIDVAAEVEQSGRAKQHQEKIERRCLVVDNARLDSVPFGRIPGTEETGVRISRIKRADEDLVHAATESTAIHEGDVVQVVGVRSGLARFAPLIGHESDVDLMRGSGDAEFRRVYVTEPQALQKPLRELALDTMLGVTVTRIIRAGIEMPASGSSRFYFGDIAHVVGDRNSLDRATEFLGNSAKSLNETRFSPLFFGIAVGVAVGMIPMYLPGVPFPVRLGLAGGPLIAAMCFSLLGSLGGFVWYIPLSANLALRELGIILFLACTGLGAGQTFFAEVTSLQGAKWMVSGFAVTIIPLLTTGIIGRWYFRQDYLTICGVIAGSMTDPPALAFANSLADSQASSTAYATVYPLTMILRIIAAQAIVFLLL